MLKMRTINVDSTTSPEQQSAYQG